MNRSENIEMTQYTIVLDLTEDKNRMIPKFSTGKLYHIIKNVCENYCGSFSARRIDGGFSYENGEYE